MVLSIRIAGGCRGGGNCRGCVLDHLGLLCSHSVPIGSVSRTWTTLPRILLKEPAHSAPKKGKWQSLGTIAKKILPEIFLTWPVVNKLWDTWIASIVQVTTFASSSVIDPNEVIVHPVKRHSSNLCLLTLFLPIKDLSCERVRFTSADTGTDQVLNLRLGEV